MISLRLLVPLFLIVAAVLTGCTADKPPATVVQPGRPGESGQVVPLDEVERPETGHTDADVRFMQGMIRHHAQALEMTGLVAGRAGSPGLPRFAKRIEISQRDEMDLMTRWLRDRMERVPSVDSPDAHGHDSGHNGGHDGDGSSIGSNGSGDSGGGSGGTGTGSGTGPSDSGGGGGDAGGGGGGGGLMPGMLTDAQLAELRGAKGARFDRLFYQYMIQHHTGALLMVERLYAEKGGQEPEIDRFATHVDSDQRIEIARMQRLLTAL